MADGEELRVVGSITSEDPGLLRVQTNQGQDITLTYREATKRWLVVRASEEIPLGTSLQQPDDARALLGTKDLLLLKPSWKRAVSQESIDKAVAAVDVDVEVAKLLKDKARVEQRGRQPCLAVLDGPQPHLAKEAYAKARHDLRYDESVVLSQHVLVQDLAAGLLESLFDARSTAVEDVGEMEAYLVESKLLYDAFAAIADEIMWKSEKSALSQAVKIGADIILETMGPPSTAAVEKVRSAGMKHKYNLNAFSFMLPYDLLKERAEDTFHKEIQQRTLLSGRCHGADLEREARECASFLTKLGVLCEGVTKVDHEEVQRGVEGGKTKPNSLNKSLRDPENREVAVTLAKFTAMMFTLPVMGLLIAEKVVRETRWPTTDDTMRWALAGFLAVFLVNLIMMQFVRECWNEDAAGHRAVLEGKSVDKKKGSSSTVTNGESKKKR